MQCHCRASHPNCSADAVAHVVPSLFDRSTCANFDVLCPTESSNCLCYATIYWKFNCGIEIEIFVSKCEIEFFSVRVEFEFFLIVRFFDW